jgi:hypothetical protein
MPASPVFSIRLRWITTLRAPPLKYRPVVAVSWM